MPPSGPKGGNGGRPNGGSRSSRGSVFLDAPNIITTLFHSNGGDAYRAVNSIDLRPLQRELVSRYGPLTCEYVLTKNGRKDRSRRFHWVRSCGWRFVEVARPKMLQRDPADVYIIERILAAASQIELTGQRTIVLISHGAHFVPACRSYLEAGGRTVVAGFIGRLSRKLYEITSHPVCDLLDFRHDLHAVTPGA